MVVKDNGLLKEYRDVWVLAEVAGGRVNKVSYELLGIARKLADKLSAVKTPVPANTSAASGSAVAQLVHERPAAKSHVVCVALGSGIEKAAESFFYYYADKVIIVDDPALKTFNDTIHAAVVSRLIKKYKPAILISGATSRGRSVMPRIAVQIETGLTADCTGLDIEPETGLLLQTRPAYGGNIIATIKCAHHRPQMSTVRQGVFKAPVPDKSLNGKIIRESIYDNEKKSGLKILKEIINEGSGINLSDADVIVTGGRGVKGPEGFEVIEDLAKGLKGAVGASRAAVDAGWISYAHQVGQTGQTVHPKIYIACGVSGQIQHLVGMQSSSFIVAINKDPEAPIMKLADVAIVGDLFEIIPELVKVLK